jgi:hypothetical protein
MKCKILVHWPNADGWQPGDVVEITDPAKLIEEGRVEIYTKPKKASVKKEPKKKED